MRGRGLVPGMGAFSVGTLTIGALALLWLGLGAAIAFSASRRYRLAQQVLDTARANARLLELMPARPLAVWADGRIEVDARLSRELGFDKPPARFGDLGGDGAGIVAEDVETLSATIESARASASTISCTVHASGSGRAFYVQGGPAPAGEPTGTLLLWFVDVS